MFRDLPIPYAQARWSPSDRWVATRHGDEVAVHAVDDARDAFTLEGRPARGLHWLSDDALCLWFIDASERPTARFEVIAVPDGGRVDAWAVDDVAAIESWSTSQGDVALLRVRRPDGPPGVRRASVVVSLRRGAVVRVLEDDGLPPPPAEWPLLASGEGPALHQARLREPRWQVAAALRQDGREVALLRFDESQAIESLGVLDVGGGSLRVVPTAEGRGSRLYWLAPDRLLRTSADVHHPDDRELLGAEVIDASTGRVLLDALGAVREAFAPRGPPHDPSWQPFAARHPRLDEDRRKLLIAQTRDASIVGQVAHLLRCELEPPFRAALPPGEFTALGWLGERLVVASADERGRVALHGAASPGAPFVEWLRVPTGVGRPRRVLVERSPAGRHVAVSFIHKRGINFGGEVHRWMTWFDASLLP